MPMNFPDMNSLKHAAKVWKFREPKPKETIDDYREQLADHVQPKGLIESMEIRTGKGWDKFTEAENFDMLKRGICPK